MAKRLFLLLLATSIGVINPNILVASDSFTATTPDFNAVETVIPEEPEEKVVETEVKQVATKAVYKAPVATPKTNPTPVVRNYTVTIFTNEMIATNLSYSDIYKFKKLIYGHNSSNLLGNLKTLSVGDTFTITEQGAVKTYKVTNKVQYKKTSDGYLEGDSKLMGRIAYTAMGHNVALMTCAGTSYGNGDASHRLVIYADSI